MPYSAPRSSATTFEKLPKLNFPEFDGKNPKLWLSRCEYFFEMYSMEPHRWIQFAKMHFTKFAARWLTSVDSCLRVATWPEFSRLLLDIFGREH
jgi:hypothetical protein